MPTLLGIAKKADIKLHRGRKHLDLEEFEKRQKQNETRKQREKLRRIFPGSIIESDSSGGWLVIPS